MTAWDKLLAASSLAIGTAWALISSPKTGGGGTIINDGIAVELVELTYTAELATTAVEVELPQNTTVAEIQDRPISAEMNPKTINAEVKP